MVKRFAFGWGLGSIAAVCAVWSGSAQADPLTAKEILQDYNLVTNGNALTTSDIEGSAAIGGNFSGATISPAPTPRTRRLRSRSTFRQPQQYQYPGRR